MGYLRTSLNVVSKVVVDKKDIDVNRLFLVDTPYKEGIFGRKEEGIAGRSVAIIIGYHHIVYLSGSMGYDSITSFQTNSGFNFVRYLEENEFATLYGG